MNKLLSDILWCEANDHLVEAVENMENSVQSVSKKTCMNCKNSMFKFLRSHLISNGIKPIDPASLHVLIAQCVAFDERFADLDMSSIDCKFELKNEDHCVESEKLNDCINTVSEIKELTGSVVP